MSISSSIELLELEAATVVVTASASANKAAALRSDPELLAFDATKVDQASIDATSDTTITGIISATAITTPGNTVALSIAARRIIIKSLCGYAPSTHATDDARTAEVVRPTATATPRNAIALSVAAIITNGVLC